MSTPERPNIVFILTDDQGPWAMHCAGNDEIVTPSLDALADRGVRFENFFCTSPVCSPARASLLTGKLPSQHGVHDWIREGNLEHHPQQYLERHRCLTDDLHEAGFRCGLSGKWHLGASQVVQHGFDFWFAHPRGGGPYNDHDMIRNGRIESTRGYVTDVITDEAVRFIEDNRDETFYLSVHYTAPHSPWDGHPKEFTDLYQDCPFKSCPQEAMHPWARWLTHGHMGKRDSLIGYFAAVTAMDRGVGRIVETLDRLALRENTLVVFTSDNGFSCGHHGFWGKGNGTFPQNMFDNSVKVPTVVCQPGRIPGGRVTEAMASQYDVLPTLLDWAGLGVPQDPTLPGTSIKGVLEGTADEARDEVVVYDEYGPVRMIRSRQWKYVHRYPYGPHELYNMVDDPDERTNLVDDESKRGTVTEMRRRLSDWFGKYAAPALDGARLPVYGSGQLHRIDSDCPGEEAFAQPG